MIKLSILSACICIALQAFAQNTFTDLSSTLAYPATRSGAPMGVADMNNDGLDDVVRLHTATILRIDHQRITGGFTGFEFGNLAGTGSEWGMSIADIDRNGYNDVIAGGAYNGLKRLLANNTGTGYTSANLPNPPGGIFLQACNIADINNNGNLDFFGNHDDGLSAPYRGHGDGTFTWDTTLINPRSTVPSDNSGNYGSVWTDYDWDGDLDLFITKCRGGVADSMDGRRLNLMFENDGDNEFTEVAESIGLRPFAQSWSTDFGDLDNDGDMDAFIIMHDMLPALDPPALFMNDGTDHFIAINDSAGIADDVAVIKLGIQVIMEDYDNNGYQDILVTNRVNGGHRLFWNFGAMQFDHVDDVFPSGMAPIHSAATGDLNHDGFIDIIAGHGSQYNSPSSTIEDDLLINQGNDNHFLSVRMIGSESNINGIGARIVILSDFGRQQRDIRSGESYGIMNSLNAHFGLAEDVLVDTLLVYWPSGETDLFENLRADQFLTLHEGIGPCDCSNPGVQTVTTLTGTDVGSLPYVVNQACPCDTIVFDTDIFPDTISLNTRLMIGKDLVIKGQGVSKTFISFTASTNAFRIQPGIRCTLSDLTLFEDGSMPAQYLIENLGELTLSNVVVQTAAGHPLKLQLGPVTTGPGIVTIR